MSGSSNAGRMQGAGPTTGDGDPVDVTVLGNVNVVLLTSPISTQTSDGSDLCEGATTDAAVTSNAVGTVSGKLRGMVAILASAWVSAQNLLTVGFPSSSLNQADGRSNTENFPKDNGGNVLWFNTLPWLFNGVTWDRPRTAKVFNTVQATANGNTTVWTPAAGKKIRLLKYLITVTDNATQAVAGALTISLTDNGTAIGQAHDVFVPALALVNTGSLYDSGWIDLGNGPLSVAANNPLLVNLSAALATGNVRVIVAGTEE